MIDWTQQPLWLQPQYSLFCSHSCECSLIALLIRCVTWAASLANPWSNPLTSDFCSRHFHPSVACCYHLDLLARRGRTIRHTYKNIGLCPRGRHLILRTKSALNLLKSELGLDKSIASQLLSGPTCNHNHNHCWGGYILDPDPSTSHQCERGRSLLCRIA